jgi:myo-inositol-1(or 4)-monophosphatase
MDELLEFTIGCAFESGRIQRKSFQKSFGIHHKGEINLVTDVDFACQARIIELISAAFPEDDIVSEEKVNDYQEERNRWIVDPLDGTTNYAHGYPFFCTSIAYEEGGEIILGVVYNPIFHELFFCSKGQGAYLNGEKLSVSRQGDMKNALLTTGFPYDLPTTKRNNIDNFVRFLFKAQAIRRDGSAALNLCYLACARFDGFWELHLNPWDTAAGCLMVAEAGGMVTDFAGEKFSIYNGEMLASNGTIHEDMLTVLWADANRGQ